MLHISASNLITILAILQVVNSESISGPLIVFLKDIEKSMLENPEAHITFKVKLEMLPENIVVIASHTQADSRKEKVSYCKIQMHTFYLLNCLI